MREVLRDATKARQAAAAAVQLLRADGHAAEGSLALTTACAACAAAEAELGLAAAAAAAESAEEAIPTG